jgi:hypothetical protein
VGRDDIILAPHGHVYNTPPGPQILKDTIGREKSYTTLSIFGKTTPLRDRGEDCKET